MRDNIRTALFRVPDKLNYSKNINNFPTHWVPTVFYSVARLIFLKCQSYHAIPIPLKFSPRAPHCSPGENEISLAWSAKSTRVWLPLSSEVLSLLVPQIPITLGFLECITIFPAHQLLHSILLAWLTSIWHWFSSEIPSSREGLVTWWFLSCVLS